ncbi:hypothetical protein HDV01_007849 [Terramyces sp. JEL0728]|nr:hypothetical protein HDV01_007849 [Terramyces sp. JEL0728]
MPKKPKETIETPVEIEPEPPIVEKTKRVVRKKQVVQEKESENSDDLEQKILDKIVKVVATKKLPKSEKQKAHIDKLAAVRKGKKMVVIDKDEEVVKEPVTKPKRIIRKKQDEPVEEPVKKKPVKKQPVKEEIVEEKPKVKRPLKKKAPVKVEESQVRTNRLFASIKPPPEIKFEHPNRIQVDYKAPNKFDFVKGNQLELASEIQLENQKNELRQALFNQQNTNGKHIDTLTPITSRGYRYPTQEQLTPKITEKRKASLLENQNTKRNKHEYEGNNLTLVNTHYNTTPILGKRKREPDELKRNKHSHEFDTEQILGKRKREFDLVGIGSDKKLKSSHTPIFGKRKETDTVTFSRPALKHRKKDEDDIINIPESSGSISSRTRSRIKRNGQGGMIKGT